MLTHSDIIRAKSLFVDRKVLTDMLGRLDGKPVQLMIGEGKDAGIVALSASYATDLIGAIRGDLDRQIAIINQQLTDMGVEP